ncbi:DUF6039 family protein [Actinosynnema sp. NPDC050801]|uniref:DUF6039 family protein n=1 Tax=unclassified Actinosynnema TaxID=2637065 RepID=UPI00340AEBB6
MTGAGIGVPGVLPAIHQLDRPTDRVLHSGNCGVLVQRSAQIAAGRGDEARRLAREAAEHVNRRDDLATVFVYEETFGVKDRVHWLIHLRSLEDYEAVVRVGGAPDLRDGVLGGYVAHRQPVEWGSAFVPGSVEERVLLPHRWGMFGTATDVMAADPSLSPLKAGSPVPWFDVLPAAHQTAQDPECVLTTATAGVVMHRVIDFSYEFRAEARLFARTVAENMNLNATGHATALVFEELFGPMERLHFFIHMKRLSTMYVLMGIDARTDPDAPRAAYLRDWVSPERGAGGWDRMIRDGGCRDHALTPQQWS